MEESQTFSADSYFATQLPPASLDTDVKGVRAFLEKQREHGRKVVLVTSGGTTVPLELNVVRFLDNFSAGTRGATSAEYFLKAGYSVIFMHRQFSLQPFSRHYSHSTNPFLDFLEIDSPPPPTSDAPYPYTHDPPSPAPIQPQITVTPTERVALASVLRAYKAVHEQGTLHTLTFVTVNDYLWLLRAVSQEMSVLKRNAMYYLAAAVSDFFLPRQKMSEHKIQSGKGSLHIEMDQVPKVLKPMVAEWTRDGYIVSFKLETDQALLIPKAKQALERYGHQVVIGNDLHHRKHRVVLVTPAPSSPPKVGDQAKQIDGPVATKYVESWIEIDPSPPPSAAPKEIEEDIIDELLKRHQAWIEGEIIPRN
ncbi:DNA/pantothenate metabolism flavoprotein [Hygrophoropsis aurantiaca]|uniref:DNA/pantothenate metabolism flavoprotein n=1 Tax=Hygrophoropsis aurantiaca TaxID=72124 RepID=A0ACB8AHB7_9AGAM|nr:DNA/pantothenate metabolism flavoprotein [Hygrophoropsis aurantiaca]